MALGGYQIEKETSKFDESNRPKDISPQNLAQWLAWQKAQIVSNQRQERADKTATIISADTFCLLDGEILEKPKDRLHAKKMLQAFVGCKHQVLTGVCLFNQESSDSFLIIDSATVFLEELSERSLEAYLDSNAWKDRAGGYDYRDREMAGWPLKCCGDVTTVQGLPMKRLKVALNFLNIYPIHKDEE